LQERPDEVAAGEPGCRHFGVSLEADELDDVLVRLRRAGDAVHWLTPLAAATDPSLNGKTSVKVADPSGNVIELKSYPAPSELIADDPP
jgi:extradiol dioxygenase family protein